METTKGQQLVAQDCVPLLCEYLQIVGSNPRSAQNDVCMSTPHTNAHTFHFYNVYDLDNVRIFSRIKLGRREKRVVKDFHSSSTSDNCTVFLAFSLSTRFYISL